MGIIRLTRASLLTDLGVRKYSSAHAFEASECFSRGERGGEPLLERRNPPQRNLKLLVDSGDVGVYLVNIPIG